MVPATVPQQTAPGTLSGMPVELIDHIFSFDPDSARAMQAVSRTLQRFSAFFLASQAREIDALCSTERSTLYSLIHDRLMHFQPHFESDAGSLIRFHLSVPGCIRSLGASQCRPNVILSPQEIAQYNQRIEDENLSRIWPTIRPNVHIAQLALQGFHPEGDDHELNLRALEEVIMAHFSAFQGIPADDAPVQDIRRWMRAEENQPTLQGIHTLSPRSQNLTCLPMEIRLLTGLQSLDLTYNELTILPGGLFQGLSQLQTLALMNNRLNFLHERTFNGLVALERISLSHNSLVFLPETIFQGLPQLRQIILDNNHLISLPERLSHGLPALEHIDLCCNPQLMNSPDGFYGIEFLERMRTFYTYVCESTLARVFQRVAGNPTPGAVLEEFSQLPDTIKNAIYECVWLEAGEPNTGDPQWGGTHAFDDMQIFCRALNRFITANLNALNRDQSNAVYGHVYDLAREGRGAEAVDFNVPNWGEQHAFDNILRLIDAMMRQRTQTTNAN